MNGTVGTLGEDGCGRVTLDAKGKKMITYYVNFDYRCDDGSGDGPYSGGGIEDKYLELLND